MTRPASLYACHNKPREVPTYLAQDGYFMATSGHWVDGKHFARMGKYIEVKHVMSTDCRYDRAQTDSRCIGCSAKAARQ